MHYQSTILPASAITLLHSRPSSSKDCSLSAPMNQDSSSVTSRQSLVVLRQARTRRQMKAQPCVLKLLRTWCISCSGMSLLMRLSSQPCRTILMSMPICRMWACRSRSLPWMICSMRWQWPSRYSSLPTQIILSYWYSISSTSAQKVFSASFMWNSSTAAMLFSPCTYPNYKSQTLQVRSTSLSISRKMPLRLKVGLVTQVRCRSFSIWAMLLSENFTARSFRQAATSAEWCDLVHYFLQGQGDLQVQPSPDYFLLGRPQSSPIPAQSSSPLLSFSLSLKASASKVSSGLSGCASSPSACVYVFLRAGLLSFSFFCRGRTILGLGLISLTRCTDVLAELALRQVKPSVRQLEVERTSSRSVQLLTGWLVQQKERIGLFDI